MDEEGGIEVFESEGEGEDLEKMKNIGNLKKRVGCESVG